MKLNVNPSDFLVQPDKKIDVNNLPTKIEALYKDKQDYKEQLAKLSDEIEELQNIMYAHDHYSLLIIFQGMDCAGKDGIIKHVMSSINPAGVKVYSFKKPSDNELEHDFMWRTSVVLPKRGCVGIFNRSYYEEVLVVKVHPQILQRYQRVPLEFKEDESKVWQERYEDIANFERYLHRQGTRVLKFFLHLSKDEQKQRLLDRIDQPKKNWKMSLQDVEERMHWPMYMEAYSAMMKATSTETSPWYAIPADDKKNARLIVSNILMGELSKIPMNYPKVDDAFKAKLEEVRKVLIQE